MTTLVAITYTNHRGETAVRRITPGRIWFGATDWHPQQQWVLEAYDAERGETRDFAMKDIQRWEPATEEETP